MSQGDNLPPIFSSINQLPATINTSSKVNGSLLRYSSTTARWETPTNINILTIQVKCNPMLWQLMILIFQEMEKFYWE